MPRRNDLSFEFGCVGRRMAQAAFDGGDIASAGGVLLLKRVEELLGLSRRATAAFGDARRSGSHPAQFSAHAGAASLRTVYRLVRHVRPQQTALRPGAANGAEQAHSRSIALADSVLGTHSRATAPGVPNCELHGIGQPKSSRRALHLNSLKWRWVSKTRPGKPRIIFLMNLRRLPAALAYTLMIQLRRLALKCS